MLAVPWAHVSGGAGPLPGLPPLLGRCSHGRTSLPAQSAGRNPAWRSGQHFVHLPLCQCFPGPAAQKPREPQRFPTSGVLLSGARGGVGGGGDPAPGRLGAASPRERRVRGCERGLRWAGGIWLLSFSATAGRVLRRGWVCWVRGSRTGRGSQLSSSGTGAVEGLLFLSSASPAGSSRAGLGLECRCLRMKGNTLRAERGQDPRGPPQVGPRGRPLPSPLLGLRWNDGLGQEVLVEVRLEEPRVGVLGEQRRRDPAQPCTAQPRPHPPSSSACRCASGHRPSRSDGASLCPPGFAPSSCCRCSPSAWPREPGTAWGVTDGGEPGPAPGQHRGGLTAPKPFLPSSHPTGTHW